MAAAVTPVRDPGVVYSSKVRPWVGGDSSGSSGMSQPHDAPPAAFRCRTGRFHHHPHHNHHRARRNTSPSLIGKNVKRRSRVDTSFLTYCKESHVTLMKTLVLNDNLTPETVNQQDQSGKTGLSHVCSNGNMDMMRILCGGGVPHVDANLADVEGNTPLIILAQAGHVEMLATLLKQYKDSLIVDQRNTMGLTALMKASLQGRVKCVKLLLLAGASPWLTDHGRGYYALQWAKYCGRHSCAEVIERFLKTTNQKQPPPVVRKKNMKQKSLGAKSSSEPDLFNAAAEESVAENTSGNTIGVDALVDNDQNFNQCPVENSNIHDHKNWLKRGLKKAFHRKSNDMKVIGNITGVGMVAAASGGIISNNVANAQNNNSTDKGDKKPVVTRVVPKVQITNTSATN